MRIAHLGPALKNTAPVKRPDTRWQSYLSSSNKVLANEEESIHGRWQSTPERLLLIRSQRHDKRSAMPAMCPKRTDRAGAQALAWIRLAAVDHGDGKGGGELVNTGNSRGIASPPGSACWAALCPALYFVPLPNFRWVRRCHLCGPFQSLKPRNRPRRRETRQGRRPESCCGEPEHGGRRYLSVSHPVQGWSLRNEDRVAQRRFARCFRAQIHDRPSRFPRNPLGRF